MNFVPAVAYLFCLNLPAAFSQPRTNHYFPLCILYLYEWFPLIGQSCGGPEATVTFSASRPFVARIAACIRSRVCCSLGPEETVKYLIARLREGVIWPSASSPDTLKIFPPHRRLHRPTDEASALWHGVEMERGFRVHTMRNHACVLDPLLRPHHPPSARPSMHVMSLT